jgi:hypothetical protein
MDLDLSQAEIEKLLQAGRLADIKLYQLLLAKVRDGGTPSASERKWMRAMHKEMEDLAANEGPPETLNYTEAAKFCGFSTRTLSWHVHRGNIQQEPDGGFKRETLEKFMAVHGRKDGEKAKLSLRKMRIGVRREKVRLLKESILVEELKKTFFPKGEVRAEWCKRLAEVTAGLQNLIDRLPPLLEGKSMSERREIIASEIFRLRERYARGDRFCPS